MTFPVHGPTPLPAQSWSDAVCSPHATFDEAVSNLDSQTAEHFARTINALKGKVAMIFITHQIPKGLQVNMKSRRWRNGGCVNGEWRVVT